MGYDNQSNSFVIFEYKRDKNFSVIDQGYAYLSLLINNKAEFILFHNEKSSTQLRMGAVDWSQSKVIFVSPSFTIYQRKAIGFRDLPMELWEVKSYSNNTVIFNQLQAPEKSESILTISQKSEVVRKVNEEVKVYTEQFHLDKAGEKIKSIYRELKETILLSGSDINVKPTAKYMAFVHTKNFADVVLYRNQINLFLNMAKGTLNDPRNFARDVSSVGHWGNGDYEVIVTELSDIGYLSSLIRQSYDRN